MCFFIVDIIELLEVSVSIYVAIGDKNSLATDKCPGHVIMSALPVNEKVSASVAQLTHHQL